MTEPNSIQLAGIHAYNWPDLHTFGFGQENFDYGPVVKRNLFKGLKSGILSHNSNMFLNTCTIEDFTNYGVKSTQQYASDLRMSQNNPTNATFCEISNSDPVGYGVWSETTTTVIEDAIIEGARYGITISSQPSGFIDVTNNSITNFSSWGARLVNDLGGVKKFNNNWLSTDLIFADGIQLIGNTIPDPYESGWELETNVVEMRTTRSGVFINAMNSVDFEYNLVDNNLTNSINIQSAGLTVNGSRALMATCNIIENEYNGQASRHGIDWNMTSVSELTCTNYYPNGNPGRETGIGLHVQNNSSFTHFRGNQLNGHITNLHYGPLSGIGNVTVGVQPHYGNLFFGYSAVYQGQPGQLFGNQFRVDYFSNFNFMPWPMPSTVNWFVQQQGYTAFTCDAPTGNVCNADRYPEQLKDDPGELELAIMNGEVAEGQYQSIGNWVAGRQLYFQLLYQQTYPPAYDDFFVRESTTSIGQMETNFKEISNSLKLGVTNQDSVSNANVTLVQIHQLLSDEYDFLMGLNPADRDYSLIDSLLVVGRQATDSKSEIYNLLATSAQSALDLVKDNNNSQVYSKEFELYEQKMIDIICRTSIYGLSSLSVDDWADINLIAYSCPDLYGEAVFRARTFLMRHDHQLTSSDFDNSCSSTQIRRGKPTEQTESNSMTVYPNPALDFVLIEHPEGLTWKKVQIHNSFSSQFLNEKPESGRIDVSTLPDGLYFILATDEYNNRWAAKFIKL